MHVCVGGGGHGYVVWVCLSVHWCVHACVFWYAKHACWDSVDAAYVLVCSGVSCPCVCVCVCDR